jgi:hypothetical protein
VAATGSVKEADDELAQARAQVNQAEAKLASGTGNVSASVLHRVRDAWRHADLSARGAHERAERERRQARLDGLAKIGTEADKLASGVALAGIGEALRDVAEASARVRRLASAHDGAVAELITAAQEFGAEPEAPGGPRSTSAFVAIRSGALVHQATAVRPVSEHAQGALALAVAGDIARADAAVSPAIRLRPARRPDYLLRGPNGMLLPFYDALTPVMEAQVRSGDCQRLDEQDIDQYMAGELA